MRILAQGLNGAPDGFPEAKGDLGCFCSKQVIAELTNDVVAGGLSVTEPSRTRAGLMFSQERICSLAYGTPKLTLRELF